MVIALLPGHHPRVTPCGCIRNSTPRQVATSPTSQASGDDTASAGINRWWSGKAGARRKSTPRAGTKPNGGLLPVLPMRPPRARGDQSVGDGEADVDYPAFVDGERRCPPEDVGGVPGFMDFLEAALDPLHVEHNEVVTWYGKPFDRVDLDERWVRLRLATLAARRRGALARHRGAARSDST